MYGGLIDAADGATCKYGSKFAPSPGKEFDNEKRFKPLGLV